MGIRFFLIYIFFILLLFSTFVGKSIALTFFSVASWQLNLIYMCQGGYNSCGNTETQCLVPLHKHLYFISPSCSSPGMAWQRCQKEVTQLKLYILVCFSICHSQKPVVMVHRTKQLRKLRGKVIDAPQLFRLIITLCVGTDRMTNIICIVVSEANKPSPRLFKMLI